MKLEIQYFLQCIAEAKPSAIVTAEGACRSIEPIEAEFRSVQTGQAQILQ